MGGITTRVRALLLLICLLTPVADGYAQEVETRNSGWGLMTRKAGSAAAEQQRWDWPDLRDGEKGTQVHLSFDLNNADVTLATNSTVGLPTLLDAARKIAAALDMPDADYLTGEGKTGVYTDIEFNDYLARDGRTRTAFDLDLAALRDALKASDLPRPVVFLIEVDKDEFEAATLTAPGAAPRKLTAEATFVGLDELPDGARLRWSATLPWYGYVAALIGLWMIALPAFTPWRLAAAKRKARLEASRKATGASDAPLDPAEVQAVYNRMPPQWVFLVGIPLLLIPLFLTGLFTRGMAAGAMAIQSLGIPFMVLPLAMIVGVGGSSLLCFLVERARERREGVTPEPADPDAPPKWTTSAPLLPMLLVFPVLLLIGPFGILNLTARTSLNILYASAVIAIGGMALLSFLAHRATRTRLNPGDEWHDRVRAMADAAGVRVRRVVVERSPALNAYATVFGTVGLTSALLRRLEPEEVEVVVAHELGHHKGEHPGRGMLLSLAVTAAILGLWWFGTDYVESRYTLSKEAKVLLNSPVFVIFLLPVLRSFLTGKAQRAREEAADRFAVDVTGDAEQVIRALRKIHTLSATPYHLKPSDEALSTHPSLANRVEAIRRYGEEKASANPR